jgi:hypothetical protein
LQISAQKLIVVPAVARLTSMPPDEIRKILFAEAMIGPAPTAPSGKRRPNWIERGQNSVSSSTL